jgi:hypothetical protein
MQASLPIDLVQDAATDCSVVASLCSAIAHDERGHHEVKHLHTPFDNAYEVALDPSDLAIRRRSKAANHISERQIYRPSLLQWQLEESSH